MLVEVVVLEQQPEVPVAQAVAVPVALLLPEQETQGLEGLELLTQAVGAVVVRIIPILRLVQPLVEQAAPV